MMEMVYNRGRYMGKDRKLEECGGINRGIRMRRNKK